MSGGVLTFIHATNPFGIAVLAGMAAKEIYEYSIRNRPPSPEKLLSKEEANEKLKEEKKKNEIL